MPVVITGVFILMIAAVGYGRLAAWRGWRSRIMEMGIDHTHSYPGRNYMSLKNWESN